MDLRYVIIFLSTTLTFFFSSCGKDSGTDDPNNPNGNGGEQTTLTISPNELTFKSEGEEKTFTITSNSNWTITNPSTWCKIDPTQGNSNTTITAIANPSEEYDDRNFNLTIKAGEIIKVVTVTQKKKDAIILTKEKYDIPTEGDNITVEVKSNISYSTIIPEEHKEWIKQIETNQLGRGLETKNLNFEISANPNTDKREGIVVIKDNSSSLADTIHVYQAQKDELILTQDIYNVSSEGENINVELKSNVDYDVIIPEDVKDWVTQITSRSSRIDRLIFNIAQNQTYDNRSTKVIIKDKNSELADTLYINQAQLNALILTQSIYEVPAEGQNIKVEIKSNIKYDIIIPNNVREWIKQIQSRSLITNIVNLSILENTSFEQRTAEIIVKDKNNNLSDTIQIIQKQNNAIILTKKDYKIPAEGEQISIEIKSNIAYDIMISSDTQEWIEKIDLSRALTTNTLNYNILPNTTYNERKAEIIIKDKDSDLSDTVKIVQDPINTIIIEKKEYNISHKGGIIKVGIKSNTGYNIIIPSSAKTWITQITSKNLITDSLTFNISENSTYEKRKAEIIICKDELADTITICQEQNDAIILDSKTYNIPIEGKQISINIQSNIDFEVIIAKESQSWIEQIEFSRVLSPTTLNFNIKQNPNYAERKGEIFIKDKNSNLSDTITIIQDAKKGLYIGDVTFRTEQDLVKFNKNGYKKIKGTLTITGDKLKSLQKLDNLLEEIEGGLIINSSTLTSLDGLYGLRNITKTLQISGSNLTILEGLNNLEEIGENFIMSGHSVEGLKKLRFIGGSFIISSNLKNLKGLENLVMIALDFEVNGWLSSFEGLNNLETIGRNFNINSGNLHSCEGLEQLKIIGGSFNISSCSLTSFNGLMNLEIINQDFNIKNASCLVSFSGLNKLNSIQGSFCISSENNSDLSTLASFEGLENLEIIGQNLQIKAFCETNVKNTHKTSLGALTSFRGLKRLKKINGNFEIETHASAYYQYSGSCSAKALNALTSFEGLENLEVIGGDLRLKIRAGGGASQGFASEAESLNALTSFKGLTRLRSIGGDFEMNVSSGTCSSSLASLTSFEGLENLAIIGKSLIIKASSSSDYKISSSLDNLISFKGLNSLKSIEKDFIIDVSARSSNYATVSSFSLKSLATFEGLENLETIGGNFKINSSATSHAGSASSFNELISFKGLGKLQRVGGHFEINSSSFYGPEYLDNSSSSLNALTSFEGLENLETIGGNFSILSQASASSRAISCSQSLNSLTSCRGLNKLNKIGGDFNINASSSSFEIPSLNAFKLLESLESLSVIEGSFNLLKLHALITLDGLNNLHSILGDLTIMNADKLNSLGTLKSLSVIGNIAIENCPTLHDFCVLKNVVQENNSSFYTTGNGYNPTKYQLLNGECSGI